MTAAIPPPQRPYGALELKQHYQKSLLVALLFAAACHLAAVGAARWYADGHRVEPPPIPRYLPTESRFVPTEPIVIIPDEPIFGEFAGAPPITGEIGIPVPMPDVEVVVEHTLITSDDRLKKIIYGDRTSGKYSDGGDPIGLGGIADVDVRLPERTVFVPYQEEPRFLKGDPPAYPSLAQGSGIEADLEIHLWIDVNGVVHEPKVINSSVEGLGFEEEALAAIQRWIFAPAQQNGEPVGIWYVVPMAFRIR
jgi:TonB family protein